MPTTITKPWGKEIILTDPDSPYTAKIFHINAGSRWSLQLHDQKTETFTLISGQANLIIGTTKDDLQTVPMVAEAAYTIKPQTIHRIEAISDSIVLEASTPEKGTTIRLEDDWNRPDETETVRNSPNRGWNQS